ncbi:TetR/AcrR family transcriptional regulator [Mucilaginibacter sp. KACC 22063]|uniref:TetR/AcrR family transcriptional regulator n=1 Tax=Mucilaginibacter sp. KACC 22063 TaxID=3025666 RepID=UPI002365099B|nr:TetR/AcrR family transcriptional regulator [Mucilaginibacter sp. KACC 22063]WDF55821.1 TetR/AcrR family transcriptional regulator [Mucilaginibacter sp. KACC 22063]
MKTGYKRVSSRTNNRPLTEHKLIEAVGSVIKKKGYKGLTARIIAREADVTTSLIFKYFGTMDKLISIYIAEKDYWMSSKTQLSKMLEKMHKKRGLQEMLVYVLEKQFDYFYRDEEMQQLILWEITEKCSIMDDIGGIRESLAREFFNHTDPIFEGSGVSFKAVAALLVSGIYYLVLHTRTNHSTLCGINIHSEADRAEIIRTIRQVLQWTFDAAKTKRYTG